MALAHCYTHGKGVDKSDQDAFRYNMQAAEMGMCVCLCLCVRTHYSKLLIVITLGYALGEYNIGVQYFSGKGVELDYAKAVEFYEKAAKQGFAPAQVPGFMHEFFLSRTVCFFHGFYFFLEKLHLCNFIHEMFQPIGRIIFPLYFTGESWEYVLQWTWIGKELGKG